MNFLLYSRGPWASSEMGLASGWLVHLCTHVRGARLVRVVGSCTCTPMHQPTTCTVQVPSPRELPSQKGGDRYSTGFSEQNSRSEKWMLEAMNSGLSLCICYKLYYFHLANYSCFFIFLPTRFNNASNILMFLVLRFSYCQLL